MSSWVLPIVIFACLWGAVPALASGDRDGDGLPDRWEKRYHLSPGKPSGKADPDRDHLSNRREYRLRTNPRNRDTDGDDYNDRIEVRKGTIRGPLSTQASRARRTREYRRVGCRPRPARRT